MIQIGDVIQARLEGAIANHMGSSHSKPRSMLHPGKLLPISKMCTDSAFYSCLPADAIFFNVSRGGRPLSRLAVDTERVLWTKTCAERVNGRDRELSWYGGVEGKRWGRRVMIQNIQDRVVYWVVVNALSIGRGEETGIGRAS